MKILSFQDPGYAEAFAALRRNPAPRPDVSKVVTGILKEVREGGDSALVRIGNRFSSEKLKVEDLRVTSEGRAPSAEVGKALRYALRNVTSFSKRRLPRAWRARNAEGAMVGENFTPLERVGIYVPGGTAPLISTAIVTVALAKVAKVPEIVVVTPPPIQPDLLYAIRLAGATEVYAAGGAQAVAALAFGTETIRSVVKIFGPGNAYVVEAKRQVFGMVGIDLIPGPSEIAVVADASCRPEFVAADLLAQAEHGPGSEIFLLTPSKAVLRDVEREMEKQLAGQGRADYLRETLEKGCTLILTKTLAEAIEGAERVAPEHLTLACRDARGWASRVKNSGAIFIGNDSPVAAGDYVAGPSHTLPTGGAGRAFAGLTVEQFLKRTSVVEYGGAALKKVAPMIATLAGVEKMDAHARSVMIRIPK